MFPFRSLYRPALRKAADRARRFTLLLNYAHFLCSFHLHWNVKREEEMHI
jgi:hypothetical protein